MNPTDISTIVQMISLIVGTITLAVAVYKLYLHWKESQPNLHIRIKKIVPSGHALWYVLKAKSNYHPVEVGLFAKIGNAGKERIVLSSYFVRVNGSKVGNSVDIPPIKLLPNEGEKFSASFKLPSRFKGTPKPRKIEIAICFTDAVGNVHSSAPFVLRVSERRR